MSNIDFSGMQNKLTALRDFYAPRIAQTKDTFVREHIKLLDKPTRMIGLRGARGVGKSTLLIQYAKRTDLKEKDWLYLSMDHLFFKTHRLLDVVEVFLKEGGELLLLDEVHRYDNWSLELKMLYDAKPDLRIVFTGSSILEIAKAEADLSRRAIVFDLPGLSFREYLNWEGVLDQLSIPLPELLEYHGDLAYEITANGERSLLSHFDQYLDHGFYPFYKEGVEFYPERLMATVDLLLEQDIPAFYSFTHLTIAKIKLLLKILAESPPYKPNISKLAERSEQTRQSILEQFQVLQRAGLLMLLNTDKKGIVRLQKPDKVFLANPNLAMHLDESPANRGSLREIFFFNQFSAAGHHLNHTDIGDFRWGDTVFEVGGKGKGRRQLVESPNAYTTVDGIDVGDKNRIPLWLFGFIY